MPEEALGRLPAAAVAAAAAATADAAAADAAAAATAGAVAATTDARWAVVSDVAAATFRPPVSVFAAIAASRTKRGVRDQLARGRCGRAAAGLALERAQRATVALGRSRPLALGRIEVSHSQGRREALLLLAWQRARGAARARAQGGLGRGQGEGRARQARPHGGVRAGARGLSLRA